MRVPGRVTLFGEAFGGLAERATASVPTRQALLSGSEAAHWKGNGTYDPDLDDIGRTLVRLGHISQVREGIRGDLPLRSGLASSTVLTLIHLGRWEGDDVLEAISATDRDANGFRPSGADSAAVRAQEAGVFGLGEWTPLPIELPPGSHLLIPPPEQLSNKLAPTLAMQAQRAVLEPLIRALVSTLDTGGGLDLDALAAYARVLHDIGVYSRIQSQVIESLLARGVVAKGVGAMYDRAILVLADEAIWDGAPPMPLLAQ